MGGRGASSGGGSGGVASLGDPREQRTDFTYDEERSLYNYTKSSNINKKLGLQGYDKLSASDKQYVENLDKAINKAGFKSDYIPDGKDKPMFMRGGGAVMIGVPESMSFNNPQEMADYINKNLIGKYTTNAGYTSVTTTKSVADGFASGQKNPVILEYGEIKKGTRGTYVSGGKGQKAISFYGKGEDETLLQRNVSTAPVQAYVKNGRVHVVVMAHGKK